MRKSRGSVLAEFGAGTVMMTMILVAFVMLFVNMYAYVCYAEKMKQAAHAAAQVYAQQNLLYGCMIVGTPEQLAASEENARAIANRILDELCVPRNRQITIERIAPENTPRAFVARCIITASEIPWPFQASWLPGSISVEHVAATGLGPIRLARLAAPDFNLSRGLSADQVFEGIRNSSILQTCVNIPILTADVDDRQVVSAQFPNQTWGEHGEILGVNHDTSAYVRLHGVFSALQNSTGSNVSPGHPEEYGTPLHRPR